MPSISLTALLHVARAGILTQQQGIDILSNNIANVNTIGYRRSRAEFQELLNAQIDQPPDGFGRNIGQAAGALLADNQRIFTQGMIQATDQQWDLAIEGEGFFSVQLPDGSLAYTRDGSFRLDGEGRLVNRSGYYLSPNVTMPPDAEQVILNQDGALLVQRRGETEPQTVATINLARFINNGGLEKIGENLFQPSASSGEAQLGQPGQNGMGQVLGFALEGSNVDLSNEIVDMISAQRAYTLMLRAMETSSEMLGLATQLR
jgi:flagellar basal-body rod protein FlgG